MPLIFLEPPLRRVVVLTAPAPHYIFLLPTFMHGFHVSTQPCGDIPVAEKLKSGQIIRKCSEVMIMFYISKTVWVIQGYAFVKTLEWYITDL